MTTDIHGWVEVRKFKDQDGQGEFYSAIKIDHFVEKNYKVFAYLFGIRNNFYFKPKLGQRGLPHYEQFQIHSKCHNEKSETLQDLQNWGVDAHDATYVTYKELKEILPRLVSDKVVTQGWLALFAMMYDLNAIYNDEDIRLVVWFDN